jgi:hypothetical protein
MTAAGNIANITRKPVSQEIKDSSLKQPPRPKIDPKISKTVGSAISNK